jgi:hypothetical protein
MTRRMHARRGQTLLETALFLPMLLLAMFAIIYFSQYGVLQERSAAGARFASLISNAADTSGFSLQELYHELHRESSNQIDPLFPPDSLSCAATAASDGANALTQAQTMPDGSTGPTAPPYFQPDPAPTQQTGCAGQSISLTSNAANSANWHFIAQLTHVEADKSAPGFIKQYLPSVTSGDIHSAMVEMRAASPDDIAYCSPGFAAALAGGLGAIEPKPLAGAFAGYQTPPPGQPHSC